MVLQHLMLKIFLVLLWRLALCSSKSPANSSLCKSYFVRHGVRRDVWKGLNGGYFLKHLTEDKRFILNKPNPTGFLENFNPPQNHSDFYGQRLSAYFVPKISGNYTFLATCDSECKVLLSKNEDPKYQKTIISLDQDHKTAYDDWTRFAEQRSCPQELESHVVYYIEALQSNFKERDHFRLKVIYPGKQTLQDIKNRHLYAYTNSSLQCSLLKSNCGILCGGSKETYIRSVDPKTKLCNFTKYIPVKPTILPDYFLNISAIVTNSTAMKILWHFRDNNVPNGITEYILSYSYNVTLPQLEDNNHDNVTYMTYSTIINGKKSAVTLTKLKEFTNYCIKIEYIVGAVKRNTRCTYAQTHEDVPSMSPAHQVMNNAPTSIRVTWQPLQERYIHGVLLGYRIKIFDLNETNSKPEVINTGSDKQSVIVKGVKRLNYYCVRILAFTRIGDGPLSQCVFILTLTEEHLLNVSTITTSSTSIQVFWHFINNYVPNGITGYRLSYSYNTTVPGHVVYVTYRTYSTIISRNVSAVALTRLRKYTMYCIQMVFLTLDDEGGSKGCTYARTNEDVPSTSPTHQVMNNDLTSIRVTWQPLQERYIHGVLRGYRIKIIDLNETNSKPEVINTSSDEHSVTVNGVKKLNHYCVRILAYTSIGDGPYSHCASIITWTEDLLPLTTIHNYTGTTAFNITWALLPGYLRTYLIGYILSYTAINHADTVLVNQPTYVLNVTANVTDYSVQGLRIYTTYRVEIRPQMRLGLGRTKVVALAATCRCKSSMKALWSPVPPYAVPSQTSTPTGLIPRLLSEMVGYSCGKCLEYGKSQIIYQLDQQGSTRGIRNAGFDRDEVDFIFPVRQSKNRQTPMNGEFYIPLLEVPGFAFLTSVKSEMAYARQVASSVFQCWPILAISLAMTVVSGFLLWLLETITNRGRLPAQFFEGVTEGVWWAFITMTTVGYGDRVPRSHIGRVFSIAWFFIGLVTVALLVGSITSSLSVKILQEQFFVKRDKKIASLNNPLDYRALMRVDERATTRTTYENIESLAEALKVGRAEGIIVDMYMAGFRTDLFNGSWYKVASILNQNFYYGVDIGAGAARLAKQFQEYSTTTYEVEIKILQQEREKESVSNQFYVHSQTVRQDIDLLDPSTSMYQLTVLFLLAALGCAVVIGMLFHSWSKNRTIEKYAQVPKKDRNPAERYKRTKEEMRFLLETFYRKMSKTRLELKEKHRRQWIAFLRHRKAKQHDIVWL